MRMGYEPVKIEDVPGFESYKVKAGEHTGFVACNEMLLYKIPEEIYQDIMSELHHYAPQDEADKIRVQAESAIGRDSRGRPLGMVEGEGIVDLDKPMPVPVFQ
jgi:signal-transduction protein with cAMP-binding, CBS, and nucleotidyltransferase domain